VTDEFFPADCTLAACSTIGYHSNSWAFSCISITIAFFGPRCEINCNFRYLTENVSYISQNIEFFISPLDCYGTVEGIMNCVYTFCFVFFNSWSYGVFFSRHPAVFVATEVAVSVRGAWWFDGNTSWLATWTGLACRASPLNVLLLLDYCNWK